MLLKQQNDIKTTKKVLTNVAMSYIMITM